MNDTVYKIESILFVASKPLTIAALARALEIDKVVVETALTELTQKYSEASGIHLVRSDMSVQLTTNPMYADCVEKFTSRDVMGELTKAQLETLTIIAYRGPVTRAEIEEIRGVNSAVIIRILRIRGLIDEREDEHGILPIYTISVTALRHLGVSRVEELPEYQTIHTHPYFGSPEDVVEVS